MTLQLVSHPKVCEGLVDMRRSQYRLDVCSHVPPAVHVAAGGTDVGELHRLLDEDPGLVNAEDEETGYRPLHQACRWSRRSCSSAAVRTWEPP